MPLASCVRRRMIRDPMDLSTSRLPAPNVLADHLAPLLGRDRLRVSVPLAPYTTFRIGGPADVLYDAMTATELATAVGAARSCGIPFFVLGLGANILVGDRGVRGLVIRNVARGIEFHDTGLVRAESGVVMGDLITQAVGRGWSGLEHFIGIPSTVGGAVWQNLHFLSPAPARERTMFIAEVVRDVELLNPQGEHQVVDAGAMKFGYDQSLLHQPGHIALAVTLQLAPGEPAIMRQIMDENLAWRNARHPRVDLLPNAGSVFKKIEGVGAGRLIDQCGLKGFSIGGARISPLHANFVVNTGGASAADVRALIAHAQRAVAAQFNQHLEPEIGFIGEF